MIAEHECRLGDPWPTGHPLPPEDPARLQGPPLGFALYHDKYASKKAGTDVYTVVKVIERSYVWSPGECRSGGGYRHYDWKVIEEGPNKYRAVVVDDADLTPLPPEVRVLTTYQAPGIDPERFARLARIEKVYPEAAAEARQAEL